jgi:MFS family permease
MISMFYTKKEMATRMAILYTGNMLASSFSGLIAAAVFQLDGRHGLAGWQWLFVRLNHVSQFCEPSLTFTDHPRRHFNRNWHRCHLHSSR